MKNENEKKGLFGRLAGKKKVKKSSCCCNIELEEISDENENNENKETPKEDEHC